MKKSHIRKLLKAGADSADMLSSLSRPSSMLNFNIMDNFFSFSKSVLLNSTAPNFYYYY